MRKSEVTGLRGPGQSLEAKSEKVKAMEKLAALGAAIRAKGGDTGEENPGRSCYKPVAPLAVEVNNLIEQRDGLCELCGEILATFTLPANQEKVAALGEEFANILARWQKRFEKHSGDPSCRG